MRFTVLNTLLLIAAGSTAARAQTLVVERAVNDAAIFLSTRSEGVDQTLLGRLMAGDVSELKPVEQTAAFNRTVPLPARATITLDVPTKVSLDPDAAESWLELTVVSTEVDPVAAFALDVTADVVSLRGSRSSDFCALGLVRGIPSSVLGTCAVAKIRLKSGDRVRVLVRDQVVGGTRAP